MLLSWEMFHLCSLLMFILVKFTHPFRHNINLTHVTEWITNQHYFIYFLIQNASQFLYCSPHTLNVFATAGLGQLTRLKVLKWNFSYESVGATRRKSVVKLYYGCSYCSLLPPAKTCWLGIWNSTLNKNGHVYTQKTLRAVGREKLLCV